MKTQTIQILVNLAKKQKIAFFYSILFILFRMLIGSFIPSLFGQAIDILTNTPKEVFQIVFIILIFSIIKLIFFSIPDILY